VVVKSENSPLSRFPHPVAAKLETTGLLHLRLHLLPNYRELAQFKGQGEALSSETHRYIEITT
jgi:hypothetical protein